MAETYRKASPCPICEGYNGAYRRERRCYGFISNYGTIYCSEVESKDAMPPSFCSSWLPVDVKLFRHELDPSTQQERGGGRQPWLL